jgi:hypothetical protein
MCSLGRPLHLLLIDHALGYPRVDSGLGKRNLQRYNATLNLFGLSELDTTEIFQLKQLYRTRVLIYS